MNPRTLSLIALAGGVLILFADFAGGISGGTRGHASVAGAILVAGGLIALAIRSK